MYYNYFNIASIYMKIIIMAKQTTTSTSTRLKVRKKKRPGTHSKCKSSVSKNAKHYTKKKVGQG